MNTKEAIERIKTRFDKWALDDEDMKAIETLIPELAESEDERIRKELIEFIQWSVDRRFMREDFHQAKRPSEWITYLEKQNEASKAIEAVERIDKYIDEHVANAYDMKDSNPDKKYYRGLDDALGKIAGILQDVYSGEKQKESLRDFIDDFPYSDEQKEQKPISSYDIVPYIDDKIAALQDMWREEKVAFDWDDMHEMIEDVARHFYQKEQKPAEWSEEDELMMKAVIGILDERDHPKLCHWLKSLCPSWKPSEEQMEALKDAVRLFKETHFEKFHYKIESLYEQLKKL